MAMFLWEYNSDVPVGKKNLQAFQLHTYTQKTFTTSG